MKFDNVYKKFQQEKIFDYSEFGIMLNDEIENISFDEIVENLRKEKDFSNIRLLNEKNILKGCITYKQKEYDIEINIIKNEHKKDIENIEFLGYINELKESSIEKWKKSKITIVLNTKFLGNSDEDYFAQLKIINAVCDKFCIFFDANSQKIFQSSYVKMMLKDNLLPLNRNLYSIHSSHDEKTNEIWLHTHGLLRCGSIELEMLKVSKESQNSYYILEVIANRFIEEGTFEMNSEILAGYSYDTPLLYTWLPFNEALNKYFKNNRKLLGCLEDRDENHLKPSGVLFAIQDGKIKNINVYSLMIKNNPVFFYTERETKKISNMAIKRLVYLKQIFKENRNFEYLLKIGYESENQEFEKEYLWFKIEEIDDKIKGALLNEPYYTKKLKIYNIYEINEEDICDWNIIINRDTLLTPDTIYKYFD